MKEESNQYREEDNNFGSDMEETTVRTDYTYKLNSFVSFKPDVATQECPFWVAATNSVVHDSGGVTVHLMIH